MFHLSVLSPSDSDIPKIHLLFLLVSGFLRPSHSFLFLFPTAAFSIGWQVPMPDLQFPQQPPLLPAPDTKQFRPVSTAVPAHLPEIQCRSLLPQYFPASLILFLPPLPQKNFPPLPLLVLPKVFPSICTGGFSSPRTLFSLLLRRFFLLFPCLI